MTEQVEYITNCNCSKCNCKGKLGFIGLCSFCRKGDHYTLKRKISVWVWTIKNYYWLKDTPICNNCGMRYFKTSSHLPCRFIKI